jgi:hypothetical protein
MVNCSGRGARCVRKGYGMRFQAAEEESNIILATMARQQTADPEILCAEEDGEHNCKRCAPS